MDTAQRLLPDGDDRPAPGSAVLVQALVNTLDAETGADVLGSVAGARGWLARGDYRGTVSEDDRGRLVEVREALREALAVTAGLSAGLDPAAAAALASAAVPVEPAVGADGAVGLRGAGGPAQRFLGDVLVAMHDAQLAGTWRRLKVCAADDCRWAFYDASRNRSGAWCSMAECGNRTKVRRFRARRGRGSGD